MTWDPKIEQHLRAKSQTELVDLLWSLIQRFPEVYEEFRERIALQEGDIDRLLTEARREIRRATSAPSLSDNWGRAINDADYGRLQERFERLLDRGYADEVVSLGRELITEGLEQVGESDDEGDLAAELAQCVAVVFRSLERSSLPGPERLLFAIDAEMADDYDAIGDECGSFVARSTDPGDWSSVADSLIERLGTYPAGKDGDSEYRRNFQRERIVKWVTRALRSAGRDEELGTILESEARATGSYEQLVDHLLDTNHLDDAERWAREGIAATSMKSSGIAEHLADRLCGIAKTRKQWEVVAAHFARKFFARPGPKEFDDLIVAARKAKVEKSVRAVALNFLETGIKPFRVTLLPPPSPSASGGTPSVPKRSQRSRTAPSPEIAELAPIRVEIDSAWPLPIPEELHPLLKRPGLAISEPTPHYEVLLEMAIIAKKPDEVIRWYDRITARPARPGLHGMPMYYADRIAVAVEVAHPQRAIEIYLAALERHLPEAKISAYESATAYLKKLRPIYEAIGQQGEWAAKLAEIREKYRNRPRFMEMLISLDRGLNPIPKSPKRK